MKTIRYFISLFLLFTLHLHTKAQQSVYFDDVRNKIDIAKELYAQKKYVSAYRQFEKIQNDLDQQSELHSEAEYFRAASAMAAGYSAGHKLMNSFIETYPESPYISLAWFDLGRYQFEKKQYTPAIRSFAKVNRKDLSEKNKIELQYQNGYALLTQESYPKALAEFNAIKNSNNLYSKPATYYWAHIQYSNENYQEALKGFTKLNGDPAYSPVIPIYVSHIYYKQEKYSEVINYTTSVLPDVQEDHQAELSKLVGDSYFHLKKYEEAIPYLETYFKTSGTKTREENYILGFCYHHSGRFEDAAELLERATVDKDEITQSAYYHLADCFIQLNDKENAKTAYNEASKFDFDAAIKEDALFSYAKLTYELSYSPFNETIKAFDRYIAEYPNSSHNTEAYRILTEVYMVTKNYSDAISSIEKIQNKTPEILKAYQRVAYFRGLELFNNLNYAQSIDYFNLSLQNRTHSREISSKAQYWKSEALYRTGNYSEAISSYEDFLKSTTSGSVEHTNAFYNLGYAYLKTNNSEAALKQFNSYTGKLKGKRTPKLADAHNRVGDYHFVNTNYEQAIANYKQAYSINMHEADYALLQIAFCEGLQRKQNNKISNLNSLLSEFPESDYRDDALYELGRANERIGRNNDAVAQYQQIVNHFPGSSYYKNALLQLGLVNFNNGDFNTALKQYKEVAENFKGTPEATSALSGIKNCYVELNNVDAYFTYIKRMGGNVDISANEQDQLTYMAAERMYMSGKTGAKEQLEKYLLQYPTGEYAIHAHFYLGELLYKEGAYSAANDHYTYVANKPNTIFSEAALSKASEMTFAAKKYKEALTMFIELEKVANSKWNFLKAHTGQMRCYMLDENYEQALASAIKVKQSEVITDELKREANYAEGKSNYELKNYNAAISSLRKVAEDTKVRQGAEAKYLLADIYYKDNKKSKAEEEIIDFIDKGTPYTYWLGKAFLLLAHIYEDNGDQFQAKHTLKSLAENYNDDTDGVKTEAQQRLEVILQKEAQQQKNAADSSFQMEIKQN